ncbi:MAG: bifunctional hydroxymethylpyrimidine kinase/phosphomethylpyrimidine kinase [Clostridiales bacterium]|nr:bifunctional hydroxymethylpyrimidine kinase/phosphomethylpyrimidine kinase [Clostridiales bacterium]
MSQVLLISDSIENTRFDVARKTSTFKSYDLEPVLAIPMLDTADGTSTKTDIGEILDYCFEECKPACIALSIIRDPAAVKLVADKLASCEHNAVLSEISLISREGEVLVTSDTYEMVMKYLLPQIQFLSINIYEAELLAQMNCRGKTDIETAARIIFEHNHSIVYINGSAQSRWHDLLCIGGQTKWLRARSDDSYLPADKSLLAAIACEMAGDKSIIEAVVSARKFFVPSPLIEEPANAQAKPVSAPAQPAAPAESASAPAPVSAPEAQSPVAEAPKAAEPATAATLATPAEPEEKPAAQPGAPAAAQTAPAEPKAAAPAPTAPSNTGKVAASYKPVYNSAFSFTAMAAQRRREQAEKQAEAEKKAAAEAKASEPEPEPAATHAPAPVKSLVSPAKSIRDIARSFELNEVNEEIAKKMSAEAEPAVTSNIEGPEPGPKGTVSEIKEREKRTAEQSLSELKALKEKFKNMSSEM